MSRALANSEFYCTQCGNRGIDIARIKGKEREAGHLKKIFCLSCKYETNHVECKPYTKYDYKDFLIEFKTNNFNEDGTRKHPYGELKMLINKGFIKLEGDFLC